MKKDKARKIKQSVARERRAIVKNFAENAIRPKPKYMPKWLYRKLINLVLNV